MADKRYLDEFVSEQKDGLHLNLLSAFTLACRKPGFPESEYATELRQRLDAALNEATDEAAGSDHH